MKLALAFLCLSVGVSLFAAAEFPRPLAWDANLEKVKVQAVYPELSPASDLGKQIETKYTTVLKQKGLMAAKGEGDFNSLTPYAHCYPTYNPSDAPAGPEVCQVGLYFREHDSPVEAPEPLKGKRVNLGIPATYSAMFQVTFPNRPEVLTKAFDALLENFVADLERQKQPPKLPRKK